MNPHLEQLRHSYDQLVAQVQQGVLPGPQAQATLESMTVQDASGAVWSIDAYGVFRRAPYAGALAEPSDPTHFADTPTPAPAPGPAFPSPFPGPAGGFDQSLFGPAEPNPGPGGFGQTFGSDQLPAVPASVTAAPQARSLNDAAAPKKTTGFPAAVGALVSRSKSVFTFVGLGLVLVILAVVVPQLSGGAKGSDVPTDPMPTSAAGGVPPAATADLPSAADAKVVIDNLSSGAPEKVQAVIASELDAPTLLRVRTQWRGAAQLEVVTTPGPAAEGKGSKIVQKWELTPPGASAATSALTVTWVRVDDAWKLAGPPTF